MIDIYEENNKLLLRYEPENSTPGWVQYKIEQEGEVPICNRVFLFTKNDQIAADSRDEPIYEDSSFFILGRKKNGYFRVKNRILRIAKDLLLHEDMEINKKTFVATRNISIFYRINKLVKEPIIIGGKKENAIPVEEFKLLLKKFPTTTELNHYAGARISQILKDYLGTISDAQSIFENYLKNKEEKFSSLDNIEWPDVRNYEIKKYEYIRAKIREKLNSESVYSEAAWQKLILEFILLLFPKYIATLEDVHIEDLYSNRSKATTRKIDIALVDTDGNLDIIEIKKPFDKEILLSRGKYRDNFTPKKELSGAVMQAEKYLFHLNKWGIKGEKTLNKKYCSKLPPQLKIKIVNPKAILILGRSDNLGEDKKFDFEIMRRKYANMIDIITYDDLLFRLDNIIKRLKKTQT